MEQHPDQPADFGPPPEESLPEEGEQGQVEPEQLPEEEYDTDADADETKDNLEQPEGE